MHVDADLFGTDAQVDAALTANAGLSDFELIGDLGSVEATLFDSGVASEGFSFAVAPGDYFSIRAMLSASVTGQSNDADAYNSLSVSFADPTGLVAVSTVPVPGTIYLFGIAAAGLSRLRRSRPAQDRIR